MTRRFAEIFGALEVLLPSLPVAYQAQVFLSIGELYQSYVTLLKASAGTLSRRLKHVSIVNNLDVVLGVLGVGNSMYLTPH